MINHIAIAIKDFDTEYGKEIEETICDCGMINHIAIAIKDFDIKYGKEIEETICDCGITIVACYTRNNELIKLYGTELWFTLHATTAGSSSKAR